VLYRHDWMVRLAGQVGLVTGGGRGIGVAVARELAAAGMQIAVTGRTESQVQTVAEEIGGLGLVGDVSRQSDVEVWVAETEQRLGRIDLLVDNAAIVGAPEPFLGAPSVRVVAAVRGERVRRVSVLPRCRFGDGAASAGSDRQRDQRRRIPQRTAGGWGRHELRAEQGCVDAVYRAAGRTARHRLSSLVPSRSTGRAPNSLSADGGIARSTQNCGQHHGRAADEEDANHESRPRPEKQDFRDHNPEGGQTQSEVEQVNLRGMHTRATPARNKITAASTRTTPAWPLTTNIDPHVRSVIRRHRPLRTSNFCPRTPSA
jgi:hypothetical protein